MGKHTYGVLVNNKRACMVCALGSFKRVDQATGETDTGAQMLPAPKHAWL